MSLITAETKTKTVNDFLKSKVFPVIDPLLAP